MSEKKTFACAGCRFATQRETKTPPDCPKCDEPMEEIAQGTPQFVIQAYNEQNATIGEIKEASENPKFADRIRNRVSQVSSPESQ